MHYPPHRKDFQIERMILFSDAVFAIAITLLIIEIKVPEIHGAITEDNFWIAFSSLLPKIIGFITSFFFIGLYWTIHHNMFGYVENYTGKLMWLNLVFLFSIVLMPFTTAVYSEFSTEETIQLISPYAIYVANIVFISVINYFLWSYISNPKNNIAKHLPPPEEIRAAKLRNFILAGVFLISLIACIWIPATGRLLLFLIPFAMRLAKPKKKNQHLVETNK